MKKVFNKKAELTTTQLVTLIVLIASFIIILYLIFRLDLGGATDKEVCRNSVFLKDKASVFAGPLNCKTNYLCISRGKDCEDKTFVKVQVNPENKEGVMKALAEEMSDCWWQFGEGKLNYGEKGGASTKYALCSVVEFDSTVQEKTSEITYEEFYEYLRKTPKDSSQTYLKYLYDTPYTSSLAIDSEFRIDISQDIIKTSEKYSIITGLDDIPSTLSDEIFKVYIIPTSETFSRLYMGPALNPSEFITKA